MYIQSRDTICQLEGSERTRVRVAQSSHLARGHIQPSVRVASAPLSARSKYMGLERRASQIAEQRAEVQRTLPFVPAVHFKMQRGLKKNPLDEINHPREL